MVLANDLFSSAKKHPITVLLLNIFLNYGYIYLHQTQVPELGRQIAKCIIVNITKKPIQIKINGKTRFNMLIQNGNVIVKFNDQFEEKFTNESGKI